MICFCFDQVQNFEANEKKKKHPDKKQNGHFFHRLKTIFQKIEILSSWSHKHRKENK